MVGAYWISWISSFWKTTLPGVVPTLRPTSNAVSSVIEMRPLARSSVNSRMPSTRLAPPVSMASCSASGLVARMLAGLSASITWRSAKPHWRLAALVQRRGVERLAHQLGLRQVGPGDAS